MIGFVVDAIVESILAPQDDAALGERRVYVDPESAPIDVQAQEFDIAPVTTRPVGFEIGGAVEFEHRVAVELDVQHGDVKASRRIRDAILVDLVLRIRDSALASVEDPAGHQEIETISYAISYAPHGISDTNESATLTFIVRTRLGG